MAALGSQKKANLELAKFQEGEASEKRKRRYAKEADELKAKSALDVAVVESQGLIREAEERLKIQDERRLQDAEQVSEDVKNELITSRKSQNVSLASSLSDLASQILVAAADDKSGTIIQTRLLGGSKFQAGRQTIEHDGTRKGIAQVASAIVELEREGLIRARGSKGEIFELTQLGFDVAEALET